MMLGKSFALCLLTLCSCVLTGAGGGMSEFPSLAFPFKREFSNFLDLITSTTDFDVSEDCHHALRNFSRGLINNDIQHLLLFDSFSRVKPGYLTFQGYNFGAYDQCLDHGRYVLMRTGVAQASHHSTAYHKTLIFKGMEIRQHVHPFLFAVCVPDNCSRKDLNTITNSNLMKQMLHPLSLKIITTESRSDPFNLSIVQLIAVFALIAILTIGIVSSIMNHVYPESPLSKNLQPFDALDHLSQLFSPANNPDSMAVTINSYKSVYCLSSFVSHLMVGINLATLSSRTEALFSLVNSSSEPHRSIVRGIMMAGTSVVSVNIVVSSCFAVMKWLPVMQKQRVSMFAYAGERVFRTLPVIGGYLLMTQILPVIPHGGPLMKHVQEGYADVCFRNGWRELLFVNNFADLPEICMPIAWFMSVEFQLHMMFFLVLVLMARNPKHAVKMTVMMTMIGWIVTGVKFMRTQIPPFVFGRMTDFDDFISLFPAKSYHTGDFISSYAIGMMLGLAIMQRRGVPNPVGHKKTLSSIACLILTLSLPWLMYDDENKFRLSFPAEVVFVSCIKSLTAIPFSFLFYALLNSHHPVILSFSRSRFAVVISRLSLCLFLMHVLVLVLTIASNENSSISANQAVRELLFVAGVSFVLSCMLYVFVEAPASRIYSRVKVRTLDSSEMHTVNNNNSPGKKKQK